MAEEVEERDEWPERVGEAGLLLVLGQRSRVRVSLLLLLLTLLLRTHVPMRLLLLLVDAAALLPQLLLV